MWRSCEVGRRGVCSATRLERPWGTTTALEVPMTQHLIATSSTEMQQCIERCSDCHDVCVETARHCLERGGAHAGAEHVLALLDCAQLCDTSRDFMLRGSAQHAEVCGRCAEACERCAESCESIDASDEVMRRCAEECRRCAESCRAMASA